jgi:hypothetical protein
MGAMICGWLTKIENARGAGRYIGLFVKTLLVVVDQSQYFIRVEIR